MRGLIADDSLTMGRDIETIPTDAASEIRNAVEGRFVCPFCGAVREHPDGVCPRCTMESTPATRQATKSRIGPWYVLQTRNPAAPGMKFETLLSFVQKGRVKPRSIVRGPTTHQLWRFAAHVKGLSREFGICYGCGESITPKAAVCPHCNRSQEPPANPDSFLETGDGEARPSQPIYRELGAAPLVADDIVVPSIEKRIPPTNPPAPATAAPAQDPSKKGADGFLTAADLAAAFKLDFEEPKGRKHKKTQVAPIAMTRQTGSGKPYRRRRWRVKLVLFLLLAASVGVGAFQYKRDANFRVQVNHWYAVGLDWSKQKWAQVQEAMAAKPQHTPTKAQTNPVDVTAPMPATSQADHSPHVQVDVVPAPVATSPAQAPSPAPTPSSPWDQLYHQNPDAVSNPAKSSNTGGDSHAAPAAKPGDWDDVMKLYRGALDAEAANNYSAAVAKYEQIKQFPKELWPSDLDLRLTQDRKLASH